MRNAPCVLTENFSTVQKLAKATKGVMVSLVWDPRDCDGPVPDLDALPKGEICLVPQPKYIIIRAEGKLIPIKYKSTELVEYRKKRNREEEGYKYRAHPVNLLFAVTYHKLQGLNLDALVLSINKHPNHKLRLTLSSLYVGVSRVHDIDKLRVLPFWKEDADYLTSLKVDPLLKLWFQNYTNDGIWKTDGLLAFTSALRKIELMRLALVDDLSFWTGLEAKQLARNLDVNVGSSNKPEVLKMLKPLYDEGRKYLTANGNLLLMRLRSELILKLRQHGTLGKLKITVLKSFAKRLGLDISQRISRRNLEKYLEKLMKEGVTATLWNLGEDKEKFLTKRGTRIRKKSQGIQKVQRKSSKL